MKDPFIDLDIKVSEAMLSRLESDSNKPVSTFSDTTSPICTQCTAYKSCNSSWCCV